MISDEDLAKLNEVSAFFIQELESALVDLTGERHPIVVAFAVDHGASMLQSNINEPEEFLQVLCKDMPK